MNPQGSIVRGLSLIVFDFSMMTVYKEEIVAILVAEKVMAEDEAEARLDTFLSGD